MSGVTLDALRVRLGEWGIHAEIHGDTGLVVGDAFHDDRRVAPGGLFCCVEGEHVDGHDLAAGAVAAGAVALLCRHHVDVPVPQIVVADVRQAVGPVAAEIHGNPSASLCCIGITGTNGKTTTAALLGAVLAAAGHATEVIGTLSGVRTTPEATDLQRTLADAVRRGIDTVVMEVSSHALVQHRVDGMRFDAAVFTNLSRDHLDYHGTMEAYFRAKARLFEPDLSEAGVVDTDDTYGRLLADAATIPISGFCFDDAEPVLGLAPLEFTWASEPVKMALAGRFNVSNALAAATTARLLGVEDAAIRSGLERAGVVPGRFETIDGGQPFTVVVDYAHTPDGLAEALTAARDLAGNNRVLVVFGAGGDRDHDKRPMMGAVAARWADMIILTNDNPRSEEPSEIAAQIRTGIETTDDARVARVRVLLDRRRAIEQALDEARDGDVVLVAGKGHETTQTIGDRVIAFDDRAVVAELLAGSGRVA